ncbi:MAG: nucleotide sugar dehydrogenase [Candidatus Omnitrophota bacterium]|nr:nucleotide sugar dehydrogenase [Candidatus Omnitrophota bacterium]
MFDTLKNKILTKKAKIGVIGLGYVGLPLAMAFAKKGFKVWGIDVDKDRVARLKKGQSYILDLKPREIVALQKDGSLTVTTDLSNIKRLDAFIVCVPTPLLKTKEPDVSFIVSATQMIKKHMKHGQIVVLESTTYPGTTEEVMLPILESTGLKECKDFYLAFSPERIDPGNAKYFVTNIPKVLGGISESSTQIGTILYNQIIDKVMPVSSAKAAEMTKLLENTFRIVNLGLVNELALMCDKLGINIWEVIEAAKTKPYGFMPFYPGPGVGGHCLTKDEYIFVKDKEASGFRPIKISDFVSESGKNPNSRLHRVKGATFIRPISKKVLSYDPIGNGSCFKEVSMLSERPYNGDIINIKTQDSRAISVTSKHPMIVNKGGQLGVKFADELELNDEIPVILNLPEESVKKEDSWIDLIEFLKQRNFVSGIRVKGTYFEWRDFKKEIKQRSAPGAKASLDDYFKAGYLPLNVYLSLEGKMSWPVNREDLMLCTGRGPSYQSIPAVMDVDEDFLRFIGYYLSEGCITVDKSIRTRLTFNRNESQYLNDIRLFLKEKGICYSEYNSKKWNSTCIKISSNIFGYLLRDILGCGVDSYSMKIPQRFMLLPKKLKLHLIMGLLRGDGGVDSSSGKRAYCKNGKIYKHNFNSATVNYFTISDTLFNQMVLLLQDLGFMPSFKKRKNLLNMFGYGQLKRLRSMFLGEKAGRIKSYLEKSRKIIPNKNFNLYTNFATTKIKDISYSKASKVYSMEVRDTNTFVTSYGILTHNCIPIDPLYLSWKARAHGFEARFIDLASEINGRMPHYVVEKIISALNKKKKALKGAKVLLIGVAYKKDVQDLRESPAFEIIELLERNEANVLYYDPYFPYIKVDGINLKRAKFTKEVLASADCVVIVTDHSNIDYQFIAKNSKVIIDTRNALKGIKNRSNIIKL